MTKTLFFDTETSDLLKKGKPNSHPDQPHMAQLAFILYDEKTKIEINSGKFYIKPEGWKMGYYASQVNGLTDEFLESNGLPLKQVVTLFNSCLKLADSVVAHNLEFDLNILEIAGIRSKTKIKWPAKQLCTMKASTHICQLPMKNRKKFKFPKLKEAYHYFFNVEFDNAHDAMADIRATKDIFHKLRQLETVNQIKFKNLEGLVDYEYKKVILEDLFWSEEGPNDWIRETIAEIAKNPRTN